MIQHNTHKNYSKVGLKNHDDSYLHDEYNENYVAPEDKNAREFHDHPTAQLRRSILSPSRPISPYKKVDAAFQRVQTHDVDEDLVEGVQNGAAGPPRKTAQNIQDIAYSSNHCTTTVTTISTPTVGEPHVNNCIGSDNIELSDDEEDLGRYNFDFNHTIGINNPFHQSNNNDSTRNLVGCDIDALSGGNNIYGQSSKFSNLISGQYASPASTGNHLSKISIFTGIQDFIEGM